MSNTEYISPYERTKGQSDGFTYYKYFDRIEILKYDKSIIKDLVIPEKIEGLPVKCIRDSAFKNCSLTSVIIPNSVQSMGYRAFEESLNLKSVTIGNGIKWLCLGSFVNCKNLISITIPESVERIDLGTFDGTAWFEERKKESPLVIVNNILLYAQECAGDVVIPDNVKVINDAAFYKCDELQSVRLPESVEIIASCAFSGCINLKSINIPDNVELIEDFAFNECKSLESITLPERIYCIGRGVFEECENLRSINIPDNVEYIGDFAFGHCESLEYVKIGNSVIKIGEYAFCDCYELKSINIPESVNYIEDSAFGFCFKLKINFSENNNVRFIGAFVFDDTEWLEEKIKENPFVVLNDILIYCDICSDCVVIPDNVRVIGEQAFFFSDIENVVINENVEKICRKAFFNVDNLKCVTIKNPKCYIVDDNDNFCYQELENDEYIFEGVICGYKNSTAQEYAEKYGYKFKELE